MPIQAVKIPQNVYVEDRIIGPVTLKQLAIVGLGAGLSYMLYATATKSGFTGIPTIVVCWSPTLLAAMFAFFKINDLSLLKIILLTIENFNKPSVRYWSPHPGITINLITRQTEKLVEKRNALESEATARLMEATRELDKRRKEMNALSAHPDQTPDNLEPVMTKLEHRLDQDEDRAETGSEESNLRPVNPSRIRTSEATGAERSIDGIVHEISTDHQTPVADR